MAKNEIPQWVVIAIMVVAAGIVGLLAYFDIQFRYGLLAIGMIGGGGLIATGLIGSTVAVIRYLCTKDAPLPPHPFETNPIAPEHWKD